jgi:hypothetical protein
LVVGNTISNVSGNGMKQIGSSGVRHLVYDNVVAGAAVTGIVVEYYNGPSWPFFDGNCFYGNGPNTSNDTLTTGINGGAFGPYAYQWNVTDGANNLNSISGLDFRLKAASGCARTGLPGVVPGGVVKGNVSFDALGFIVPQANGGSAQ